MILIKTKITKKGAPFNRKEMRVFMKDAWQHTGNFWHKFIMGKHFTRAGAREYGYKKRQQDIVSAGGTRRAGYETQKFRKFGHRRELVWSGESERSAKRIRDVRATSKGVRIVLHVPRHFKLKGPHGSNQPDKTGELERVSQKDIDLMATVYDRRLTRLMNSNSRRETVSKTN